VEQQNSHPADSLRAEAVKWACDELGLDPRVGEGAREDINRQAVCEFFVCLNANGFFVEGDKAEAVEMVLGNSTANAPHFRRHLNQQGFKRLDGMVEWVANELGVMHGPSLLNVLEGRLAKLDLRGCSEDVDSYAQRIWKTCLAVDRKVLDGSPAVTKILQALFHISTIRQSQRCRIRNQWLEKLRNEFSVDELDAAKQALQRTAVTPMAQFHRPFLFMLTRQVAELGQCQLPPPVDSRRPAPGFQLQRYQSAAATSSGFDRFVKGFFFSISVLFGIGVVFYASKPAAKPSNVIEFEAIKLVPESAVEDQVEQPKDQDSSKPRFDSWRAGGDR